MMLDAATIIIGALRIDSGMDSSILRGRALLQGGAEIISVIAPDMPEASPMARSSDAFAVVSAMVADGVPVGIETMDADTAATAVSLGATLVLDPTGGRADARMASVASGHGLTFIANVLSPEGLGSTGLSVAEEFSGRIGELLSEGLPAENLVVDLGVGLAEDPARNWLPLTNIDDIIALGYPVMMAASRGGLLNSLLPHGSSLREREAAALGVSIVAFGAGVWAVRVENVARIRDSLKPFPIGHADHAFTLVTPSRQFCSLN
jgi:dihydropteroate synthase